MLDLEQFGEAMGTVVREAVAPLVKRIGELEKQLASPVDNGAAIRDAVEAAVAELPAPKDGVSVTLADVEPVLEAALAKWALEFERRGQDLVQRSLDRIQQPKDGRDGTCVNLEDIAPFLESAVSKWALEFERRGQDLVQRSLDRIQPPKDGKDGRDGFGFEDMQVEHDGCRSFGFVFTKGSDTKRFEFTVPAFVDRGVFRESEAYEAGDGVTWGGSFFIAQKAAPVGKPGEPGSEGWRLAVKRGRDGKDGRDGIDKTAAVKL